jgi:hypothetical protein
MNTLQLTAFILLGLTGLFSCVQKTHSYPVRFVLDVSHIPNVDEVAIRGSNRPLTWENDFPMQPLVKDSLYVADITFVTGYLGAEVKFVVNGQFELPGQENRRFMFDTLSDTTVYKAVFDKIKQ